MVVCRLNRSGSGEVSRILEVLDDLDSMTVIWDNTVMLVEGHDAFTLDELSGGNLESL